MPTRHQQAAELGSWPVPAAPTCVSSRGAGVLGGGPDSLGPAQPRGTRGSPSEGCAVLSLRPSGDRAPQCLAPALCWEVGWGFRRGCRGLIRVLGGVPPPQAALLLAPALLCTGPVTREAPRQENGGCHSP